MKKPIYLLLFISSLIIMACGNQGESKADAEAIKQQIVKTEKDFETMAAEKGIAEAFWHYADSNAVIKRENDTLINGKDNIRRYYASDFYKAASVKWAPDFVDVSPDGNMAWTYGKYTWQSKDSSGKTMEYKGVFHTVWKRQDDGGWKYVWD